jgi:thioredoxin-related protein
MKYIITLCAFGLLVLAGCGKNQAKVEGVSVHWVPFDRVQAFFPAAPRPMFLFVMESGCGHCERMDSLILSRPEVAEYLNKYFTPIRVDLTQDMPVQVRDSSMNEDEFRQFLSIEGVPAYYFFDQKGQVIGALFSEMDLLMFKRMLVYIRGNHFMRRTPWADFLKMPEADLDTVYGKF